MRKEDYGIIIASIIISFTIGWLWGLNKNEDQWFKMLDLFVSIGLVVVTGFMFYSISKQVKQGNEILQKEMQQLELNKDNFSMKIKLNTLDFLTLFEKHKNNKRWINVVSAIRHMNNDENENKKFRDDQSNINNAISVLDSYEWLSIRCNFIESYIDFNIIDEMYGIEMYEILENNTIKEIKRKVRETRKDFCSNLDIFYPKIREMRKRKLEI